MNSSLLHHGQLVPTPLTTRQATSLWTVPAYITTPLATRNISTRLTTSLWTVPSYTMENWSPTPLTTRNFTTRLATSLCTVPSYTTGELVPTPHTTRNFTTRLATSLCTVPSLTTSWCLNYQDIIPNIDCWFVPLGGAVNALSTHHSLCAATYSEVMALFVVAISIQPSLRTILRLHNQELKQRQSMPATVQQKQQKQSQQPRGKNWHFHTLTVIDCPLGTGAWQSHFGRCWNTRSSDSMPWELKLQQCSLNNQQLHKISCQHQLSNSHITTLGAPYFIPIRSSECSSIYCSV